MTIFQTFENMLLADRAEAILESLFKACTKSCTSRHYTPDCGAVVVHAMDVGNVCSITLADSAGQREKNLLTGPVARDFGCPLFETEVIYHQVFRHPHPRMRDSKRYVQCELFRRT